MSQETLTWLNQNVLIGFTDKRGKAWHYDESSQGEQSNHYAGAVPVADVLKRLFYWDAVEGKVKTTYRANGRSHTVEVPGKKTYVHPETGQVFAVVGSKHAQHPYRLWLIDNFKKILDAGDEDLGIGSAGLLKGGAQAWVQLELPETIDGPGGIKHRPFLTGSAVFDGSRSTSYSTGTQIAVCDNTLSAALAGASAMVKYAHRAGIEMKVQDVRDALAILMDSTDAVNAELEQLLAITVTDAQWEQFLTATLGERPHALVEGKGSAALTKWDNAHDTYTDLWNTDPMVAPWKNTGFGALQAVNTYRHHHAVAKGVEGGRPERNLLNRVDGTNDKQDAATLQRLQLVLAA